MYGYQQLYHQKQTWKEILTLKNSSSDPWLIIEDFKEPISSQ